MALLVHTPSYLLTATTSTSTWNQWIGYPQTATSTTTSLTLSTADIWNEWVNVGCTTATYYFNQPVWDAWERDERTQEEIRRARDEAQARREQQAREWLAADQKRQEDMAAARERGRELLHLVVAEEDRIPELDQLLQVEGSDGELYRIEMHRQTVHGNIVRVDEHGCILGRACVAPAMYADGRVLPTEDGWVGQYLGLKFDADQFLSHANWSHVRACQVQQDAAA